MAVDRPAFFPFWAPPSSWSGLFKRARLKRQIQIYVSQPLDWRRAEIGDWPGRGWLRDDFRHAREAGYGFVAVSGDRRAFLIPRGWERPEWALADTNLAGSEWRDLGDIEPVPVDWSFQPSDGAPTK